MLARERVSELEQKKEEKVHSIWEPAVWELIDWRVSRSGKPPAGVHFWSRQNRIDFFLLKYINLLQTSKRLNPEQSHTLHWTINVNIH